MDISVVIPIYNVEQYLRRCLDSVLRQERISIEVILVDDGSTDTSGKICDEYAVKHENVHCLHVKNGGPATAKNKGYEVSCNIMAISAAQEADVAKRKPSRSSRNVESIFRGNTSRKILCSNQGTSTMMTAMTEERITP